MEISKNTRFSALKRRFEEKLSNGQRADLKRAKDPYDDLPMRPAYYALMGPNTYESDRRVAFFMPWISHKEGGGTLGQALSKAKIDEKRLFQVVRSEAPNDLIQLRRLVQHVKPVVDWNKCGKMLSFWNDISRRQLLSDFYTSSDSSSDQETQKQTKEKS